MDQNIVMVIVYAHVTLRRRNSYGRRCFNKKNRKSKTIWCLASDVNATRKKEDKVGLSTRPYTQNREMNDFNEFYELMELPNILMIWRIFTWYKSGGLTKSILYRFLVSEEWLKTWPNLSQFILNRTYLDHCPLILKYNNDDWGPKSFKVMNRWFQEEGFQNLVKSSYEKCQVQGCGLYKIKEKLKALKRDIRAWNKVRYDNLEERTSTLEKDIVVLDLKDEQHNLSIDELAKRAQLLESHWEVSRKYKSFIHQRLRIKWQHEGDNNTIFSLIRQLEEEIQWRQVCVEKWGLVGGPERYKGRDKALLPPKFQGARGCRT